MLDTERALKTSNSLAGISNGLMKEWLSCRSSSPLSVLTGEVLHDAGQNPIVASSIGKSQHTQVSKVP